MAQALKRNIAGLHPASLASQVLDFTHRHAVGLLARAAAADVIAADCRFNAWCEEQKKVRGRDEFWWARVLDDNAAAEDRCLAAMTACASGGSEEIFCDEMLAVAASLNQRPR